MSADFSAAVICGGRSRRMGQDKAFLRHPGSGEAMWRHQLQRLRLLQPDQCMLAANPDQSFPEPMHDVVVVRDHYRNRGPLAGLHACLDACRSPLLAALAVDMPQTPIAALTHLLSHCRADCGAVFVRDGRFEPLAAVYPRQAAITARSFLEQDRLRLQDWVRSCVESGLLAVLPLTESFRDEFHNINTPQDYEQARSSL